jgi:hypothetical protein
MRLIDFKTQIISHKANLTPLEKSFKLEAEGD